ncbi:MAG: urea ABC transporter ATP-binding subunit UrtE [Pseudomonadota bacterium]
MLRVESLNQYYGGSHTLRDISLQVPAGQCTCIMGRNGVGKTTLLDVIMGLLPIRTGLLQFEAPEAGPLDLAGAPAERRAALGIGYVPQGRMIFPQLTVAENLELPLRAARLRSVPERIYELFPVLAEMANRRGGDLSGGQQQQLAIARALVLDPVLLILDEPCEGIAPNIVADIGTVLSRLCKEQGMTLLLVEQKLPFARRVADGFIMLERGAVVAQGKMDALDAPLIDRYLKV